MWRNCRFLSARQPEGEQETFEHRAEALWDLSTCESLTFIPVTAAPLSFIRSFALFCFSLVRHNTSEISAGLDGTLTEGIYTRFTRLDSLGFYPIYIWLHKTKCALLLQCNILKMVKNMKMTKIWQIIQQNRNPINIILRSFHLDMLNTWINWQNTNVDIEKKKSLWDLSFVK